MAYLVDTNVLSELRKGERCDAGVAAWFARAGDHEIFLSVLVMGELQRGVDRIRRRDVRGGDALGRWLEHLMITYADRILPVTLPIARLWGSFGVPDPVPTVDGLLAATAQHHGLVFVTRNEKDVVATGVRVLNPFKRA
jgi:predicted nucleic acid-binding protein